MKTTDANSSPQYPQLANFSAREEFKNLNGRHKAITVITSIIITLFTLGIGTAFVFPALVGRFRRMEIDEATAQGKAAAKTGQVGDATLPGPNKPDAAPKPDAGAISEKADSAGAAPKAFLKPAKPATDDANIKAPEKTAQPIASEAASEATPLPFEQLQKDFWQLQLGDKEVHRFLEKILINANCSLEKKAALIIDNYVVHKKVENFLVTAEERKSLMKVFLAQFPKEQNKEVVTLVEPVPEAVVPAAVEPKITAVYDMVPGQIITTFKTEGDGSCGLHALLGTIDKNGTYRCDAKAARQYFCDWLEQCRQDDQLPDAITTVLTDYFSYPDGPETPSAFIDAVREKLDHYKDNYQALTKEQKDERKYAFIHDPEVFAAYLDHIRPIGRWLLQDELEAAAYCFNKRVILHQALIFADTEIGSTEFNPMGAETVHIWYDGATHYERAAEQLVND